MTYFREHVAADYLSGGFDGDGELIMLVHGEITPSLAASLVERLRRVGQDFAQAHLADQRLPDEQRTPRRCGRRLGAEGARQASTRSITKLAPA